MGLAKKNEENKENQRKRPGHKKGTNGGGGRKPAALMFDKAANVKKFRQYAANLMSKMQIARCFGLDPSTLYNVFNARPDLEQLYYIARNETLNELAEGAVKDAKSGNQSDRLFILKAHAGWNDKVEVQHTGAIKHEIELATVKRIEQMTPEQQVARLEELKKLRESEAEIIDVEVD